MNVEKIAENELQSAIVTALQAYATLEGITIQSSWKYSNQQGEALRKLCADFATVLNHSSIFLAEVKVQQDGVLDKFNSNQFKSNLAFEKHGYPIYYVYNSTACHPYWQNPQPTDWYKTTLSTCHYSSPSKLPGKQPAIQSHRNLLDWLKEQSSHQDRTEQLAEIFARIRSNELNNAILMLVYGTKKMNLFEKLDAASIDKLIKTLRIGSRGKDLSEKEQKILEKFLAREAEFFRLWYKSSKEPSI
jgi:hypothetical protein